MDNMNNNSINRRILKAKRGKDYDINFDTRVPNQDLNVPKYGCKRQYESTVSPSNIGHIKADSTYPINPHKFSANDRLKQYRESLSKRPNEIVKVHQVFTSSCDSCKNNAVKPTNSDSWKNNTVKPTNSDHSNRLGKRSFEHVKENKDFNDEVSVKKGRINEDTKTSKYISSKAIDEVNISQDIKNPKPLHCKDKQDTYVCEDNSVMDWSPIDQNEVVYNIQKFRERCKENPSLVQNPATDRKTAATGSSEMTIERRAITLYVVIDTNIFISHLSLVKTILSSEYSGSQPIVYVPWMVIQELDYFKDGRTESSAMMKAATKAIAYINQNLMDKDSRLKGQTVHEALREKESSANSDDNIIFCCLNLMKTDKLLVLLSNDTNLRNKALINNIASVGPKAIVEKIREMCCDPNDENKEKIHQINLLFANMCSEIIISEMEEAYGTVLYNLITRPPWDLKQCLIYIKRFWNPVFSLAISQKQCLKIIDDLLEFICKCEDMSSQDNMDNFIKLCFSICVYFKNCLRKYQSSITSCVNKMKDILS